MNLNAYGFANRIAQTLNDDSNYHWFMS